MGTVAQGTQYRKGRHDGWRAKDTIELGTAANHYGEPATRVLQIETYKRSQGGLVTHASCALHSDGLMTFDVFGDYSKTVANVRGARCTEKSVRDLHSSVMEQQSSAIVAEARAFYEAKDAKR